MNHHQFWNAASGAIKSLGSELDRNRRTGSLSLTLTALVFVISGCQPTGTPETFCATLEIHKDRYLDSMQAASEGDPLAGLLGAAAALGDLKVMWIDLAEQSPPEIRADVEIVRDAWIAQEKAVLEGDLLGSIGSALFSSSSMARVDEYMRINCDLPSNAQPPVEVLAPNQGTQPEQLPAGNWWALGPGFVPLGFNEGRGKYFVSGQASFYLPQLGLVSVDAHDLLPSIQLEHQLWTLGMQEDAPVLVGVIRERIAAQGLEPATYRSSVVSVDPVSGALKQQHVVLASPTEEVSISSIVGGAEGLVAIATSDGQVMGVNARSGDIAWTAPGYPVLATYGTLIVSNSLDEIGAGGVPCRRLTALSIVDGSEAWYVDSTEELYERDRCRPIDFNYTSASAGYNNRPYPGDYLQVRIGDRYSSSLRTDRGYDLATGTARIHRDRLIAFDGATGWAVRDSRESETIAIEVWDTLTGDIVYTIDRSRAEALQLRVSSMMDGMLYASTSDEHLAIDVLTGDLVPGNWAVFPTQKIEGWLLMSDNRLIPTNSN